MSEIPESLQQLLHEKKSICAELKKLAQASDIDYQSEINRLSEAYQNAGAIPPEYAELLDKEFSESLKAARDGESAYMAKQDKIAKLTAQTQSLIAAGDLATLKEIISLEESIKELLPASDLIAQLAPLKEQLTAEEAAVKAAEEAAIALAAELDSLCAQEDINLLRERKPAIEAEFAQLANIPRQAALRYNDAHRKASIKLAQHYETLDLARWESYTRKLDLCAELERLLALPDEELGEASKKLNSLRDIWKNLGSVPKEKSEEINPRYLSLSGALQRKIDEYFARKRQMQKTAIAEKEQLCIEAEALANSTDWKNTAVKMKELQAKWKVLPRAGAKENELFQRFRAGQDIFFNARKAAFDERDKKFNKSEEIKKALIAEAENLTDTRRARELREEFRNAGFAGKNDQALYQSFNAAMDKFFNARKAENASRGEKANELLDEVKNLTANPVESLSRIREIREELRNLNCRETRQKEQLILREYEMALNKAREEEQRRKEENSDSIAMLLAKAYEAWKNGENADIPTTETLSGFNKLQSEAKLLAEAIAGDAKAAARLDKQIDFARSERERICCELEKLCGNDKAESAETFDLAAELQSAMLGDFGKGSGTAKAADPQKLCAEFAACGIVPAKELAEFQERFNAAKKIIFQN